MDEITRRVRAFYTEYPYPAESIGLRFDAHPRLLLSYLAGAPDRRIRVLDSGCGASDSLIAMAGANPDADVLGADLNPTALQLQRERIGASGLSNVQVAEVDLMSHAGLEVPAGGFDVVLSSGVLHHLSDPPAALRRLGEVLAPQGVLVLMVYGRYGRQHIARLGEAIERARPRDEPVVARLGFARALVKAVAAPGCVVLAPDKEDPRELSDVEFVDRYLHIQERTYTVRELFELLGGAGLQFLRWLEPREWSVAELFDDPGVVEELLCLDELTRCEIVERLFERPALTLVACREDAQAAPWPSRSRLQTAVLSLNPQAAVSTSRRVISGRTLIEDVVVQVRNQGARRLGDLEASLVAASEEALPGRTLVERAKSLHGSATEDSLWSALEELLAAEVLYVERAQ